MTGWCQIAICCWVVGVMLLVNNHVESSITITKILAGKKKFKTYSLGLSFVPTLVKVKPNKFHLTIRQNQYVRPKKFKMDGSLPLKVPTILAPKRNPYAPVQEVNINADLSLGPQDTKKSYGHYSAASQPEPVLMSGEQQAPSQSELQAAPSQINVYDHSLNAAAPAMNVFLPPASSTPYISANSVNQPLAILPPVYPQPDPMVPAEIKRSSDSHQPYVMWLERSSPFSMQNANRFNTDTANAGHGALLSNQASMFDRKQAIARQMSLELSEMNPGEMAKQRSPMKINIGEHYDPNMIYMDEQLSAPNIDESANLVHVANDAIHSEPTTSLENWPWQAQADPMLDTMVAESIQYPSKYGPSNKKYNKHQYKYNNDDDDGPDDIRIDFSLTGPHGGPKVPYGFGNDQDQLNKQLNMIQQHIPVGLHAKQIYNYYLRHTFTEPLKAWPHSYAHVKKIKMWPKRKKNSRAPGF